jgi:diguanylate cyclase (GGDEF)-like protein/PAS domain S-box-containing protein
MDQHDPGIRADTEGLWDWNLASNRIHFSPRWISLVGCEDHEVGNAPEEWLQRVHPEDLDRVMSEIEAARKEGPCEFDFRHRLRHKDGTYRWMSGRAVVVRNEGGQAIRLTGSHSDVTVDTVTDSLTGLPNRLLLLDRLTGSIERAVRYQGFHFAVLLIDLGRPAGAAEPSGPTAGNPLLTAAARRLETSLRTGDTSASSRHNDLVARLQGDQFAVLLDGLKDVSHAKVVADRLLGAILAPFTVSGREVFLSASVGIAVSATGYTRADDVLGDAQTALHRALVLGGSHCEVFDTAILKSEQAELQLEGDFKEALEQREFQLFYQPIVSLSSNQIVGFEALVRWQHPVLGMIPPLDFISIAERTGFIVPLGNWIVREACFQLRAWQDSLPLSADLWMSVNLSGVQLRHAGLVEQIGEALRDSGLEARRLVLELTESIAMENPTAVKTLLMQLQAMGVRISVDDFGTGYSSLAYLRQFPVDALKVDRSFIRGMETRHDTADIVGALTSMAQQLGLYVVAEGIENEEQLALLRSLNCESAQGYLFAKPLDVTRATELLKTGFPPRPETAGDNEPSASLRPEEHMPEPPPARRHSSTGRRLSMTAAALAVLTSAGLVARFTNGRRPVESSSQRPLQNAQQGLHVGTLPDAGIPSRTSEMVAVSAAAAPAAPRLKINLAAESSAQHPAVMTSDATVTPVPGPTSASTPNTPRPAVQELTSVNVVHLHGVGSCHGRLVVSREGVAFVPDEKPGKDAFDLKYSEFLSTLADSKLVITSNTRTYRFKAAAVAGKNDSGSELHDVVERIARFR